MLQRLTPLARSKIDGDAGETPEQGDRRSAVSDSSSPPSSDRIRGRADAIRSGRLRELRGGLGAETINHDLLGRLQPSPIVSLNRAAAVAMVDGPGPALALIDGLAAGGDLDRYHLLHAARADLRRRLGSWKEAAQSYARAIELVTNAAERRFLERRLREVQGQAQG